MAAFLRTLVPVVSVLVLEACGSSTRRWNCKLTCADGTERGVTVSNPIHREPCDEAIPDANCPGGPILACKCEVDEGEPSGLPMLTSEDRAG
jgi:hypothetical protein